MGGISDSLSGYFIRNVNSHLTFVTSSDKYWWGIFWPGWALHLKTWPNSVICFKWALIDNIDQWTLHILSLAVSCGGYIWKVIWVLHLTSYICHFIWQVAEGIYLRVSSENLSSRMFRCGHQRGLFALHKTKKQRDHYDASSAEASQLCKGKTKTDFVFGSTAKMTTQDISGLMEKIMRKTGIKTITFTCSCYRWKKIHICKIHIGKQFFIHHKVSSSPKCI